MRLSERARTIRELTQSIAVLEQLQELADSSDSSFSDDKEDLEDLREMLAVVLAHRYMNPRTPIPRPAVVRDLLFEWPDDKFRQITRFSKDTFAFVEELIANDPVFHNNSKNKQRPVCVQLAIALERLGAFGNAASNGPIARRHGVGSGSVNSYFDRVITALSRHYSKFVRWPSVAERTASSTFYDTKFGMPGAIGMVDGSHVRLAFTPAIDRGAFHNSKGYFSLNVMVYCDESHRIIRILTGWPGSCSDSSIYETDSICKDPETFLDDGQFLLGDSGFSASQHMLTPYDGPDVLLEGNSEFNQMISSARVINESIGMWKGRWSSLRGIRRQIKVKKDIEMINVQILVCALLHNIAIAANDEEWEAYIDPDPVTEGNNFDEPVLDNAAGVQLRENIKQSVHAKMAQGI